jgi:uncharacterized circularly permuted ATP-grasp superfamily protein/uncharacterized alpha-E superfamily protein
MKRILSAGESCLFAGAQQVALGHYDELRDGGMRLRPLWQRFADLIGEDQLTQFPTHASTIDRAIRHHAISYNVYQDQASVSRAWSLNPLPFLMAAEDWQRIAEGIAQRASLLNQILIDAYGEQRLLKEGLFPAALLHAHPGYLRSMCAVKPIKDLYLAIVAFDLARGPDGQWWVVSQRCQSPSGLGYMLENRHLIAKLFPQALKGMNIQSLAASYRQVVHHLMRLAMPLADGEAPRLALLTAGPWSETYFEHAYLAAYLGLPLVTGSDLIVQGEKLYLKTLQGLQRLHGLLRRIDDELLDPLELRPDSSLGVPGLIQVLRAQAVVLANTPGSGFLESPAIQGFLPAIARQMLGETLKLPSLHSWWCGEAAAFDAIEPLLKTQVIKPSYAGNSVQTFEPVIALNLSKPELAALRAQIRQRPEQFTAQTYLPFSQTLTWQAEGFVPKTALIRVFAIANSKGGWDLLPGGMTRIANIDPHIVSIARGGSTLDTWVESSTALSSEEADPSISVLTAYQPRSRPVSSRAAEHLFWLGRYSERAEHLTRFAKELLLLSAQGDPLHPLMAKALTGLAKTQALVNPDTPGLAQSPVIFVRSLLAELVDPHAFSLGFCLAAIDANLRNARDLFPSDPIRLIHSMRDGLQKLGHGPLQGVDGLDDLSLQLAALQGLQSDRMTRDLSWRLMLIGRSIERLICMSETIEYLCRREVLQTSAAFEALLNLFDSIITYRVRYQGDYKAASLIELLIIDQANPRAIAAIIAQSLDAIAWLPNPAEVLLDCQRQLEKPLPNDLDLPGLVNLAQQWTALGRKMSDLIGAQYFSHVQVLRTTV